MRLVSHSPEQTHELGKILGRLAQPGDVFLLVGNLGAGKTCLTQGIAWGLGITEYIMSPSFVIMREYLGRLPMYHVDLYRLENAVEIADLGLDEYFYGRGLSVVEWADRAVNLLPADNLTVAMEHVSLDKRVVGLKTNGKRYEVLVDSLRADLEREGSQWSWQ